MSDWDTEEEQAEAYQRGYLEALHTVREVIASDALAITYQSMAQYRKDMMYRIDTLISKEENK